MASQEDSEMRWPPVTFSVLTSISVVTIVTLTSIQPPSLNISGSHPSPSCLSTAGRAGSWGPWHQVDLSRCQPQDSTSFVARRWSKLWGQTSTEFPTLRRQKLSTPVSWLRHCQEENEDDLRRGQTTEDLQLLQLHPPETRLYTYPLDPMQKRVSMLGPAGGWHVCNSYCLNLKASCPFLLYLCHVWGRPSLDKRHNAFKFLLHWCCYQVRQYDTSSISPLHQKKCNTWSWSWSFMLLKQISGEVILLFKIIKMRNLDMCLEEIN